MHSRKLWSKCIFFLLACVLSALSENQEFYQYLWLVLFQGCILRLVNRRGLDCDLFHQFCRQTMINCIRKYSEQKIMILNLLNNLWHPYFHSRKIHGEQNFATFVTMMTKFSSLSLNLLKFTERPLLLESGGRY